MRRWVEVWAKHAALNFGQVCQGLRYLGSHPDIDEAAPRGTVRHAIRSLALRGRRVANDAFFTVTPPQWHHAPPELVGMASIPARRWFQFVFWAWRFTQDGELRGDVSNVDRRWDPRCMKPEP
jgi:hypothetical protein